MEPHVQASPADFESLTKPSPEFVAMAEIIGRRTGLDAQKIAAGAPIELNQSIFWITHLGAMDPQGATLMLKIGDLPEKDEGPALRRLLETQAMMPASRVGYFCVIAGTKIICHCTRVQIDDVEQAAEAITAMVEQFRATSALFDQMVDEAITQSLGGGHRHAPTAYPQ